MQTYVQTDKYIRLKNDAAAPESLKRILRDRAEENRERKTRLTTLLETMVVEGDYYACGQTLKQKITTPKIALYDSVSYMIANIFTKLGYLNALQEEPQKEIRAVLLANDIGQYALQIDGVEAKRPGTEGDEAVHRSQHGQEPEHPSGRPRGPLLRPSLRLAGIGNRAPRARLFVAGEIKLMVEGEAILPKDAIEPLTKSVRWKQVKILKRKAVGAEDLTASRKLGQELFRQIGPDSEDGLHAFLRSHLLEWEQALNGYKPPGRHGKLSRNEGDR